MSRYHPPKLYKRPNTSFFWIRFYEHGKLRRHSTGTDDPVLAQKILDQRIAQLKDTGERPAGRLTIAEGFAWFGQAGGLTGEDLVHFRRLQPLLLGVLYSQDVTTFRMLGNAHISEIFRWLSQVELSGVSVESGEAGEPVYVGSFRLTQGEMERAWVFLGRVLEFVSRRTSPAADISQ